jgi:hypothetical protein
VDEFKARAASADQERRERLNKRLRQAFIEGPEEDSRRRLGRGLTAEEWSGSSGTTRARRGSAASPTGSA